MRVVLVPSKVPRPGKSNISRRGRWSPRLCCRLILGGGLFLSVVIIRRAQSVLPSGARAGDEANEVLKFEEFREKNASRLQAACRSVSPTVDDERKRGIDWDCGLHCRSAVALSEKSKPSLRSEWTGAFGVCLSVAAITSESNPFRRHLEVGSETTPRQVVSFSRIQCQIVDISTSPTLQIQLRPFGAWHHPKSTSLHRRPQTDVSRSRLATHERQWPVSAL